MFFTLRVGAEWIERYQESSHPCKRPDDLFYAGLLAWTFLDTMRNFGHQEIFNWGNMNAWSTDFEHPDRRRPLG